MALVDGGVPFDVAFSLNPVMRQAMLIVRGQNKGGEFDFNAWSWRSKE